MKNRLHIIFVIFILLSNYTSFAKIHNTTDTLEFVFLLDSQGCINCFNNSIKDNIKNIKTYIPNSKISILIRTQSKGDIRIFKKIFKNIKLIETTKKIDIQKYGLSHFPCLLVYNSSGILLKSYDEITQYPPLFSDNYVKELSIDVLSLKTVPIIETDSIFYSTNLPCFYINKDRKSLVLMDYLQNNFTEVNINTGKPIKQWTINKEIKSHFLNRNDSSIYNMSKKELYENLDLQTKMYDLFSNNGNTSIFISLLKSYTITNGYDSSRNNSTIIYTPEYEYALVNYDTNLNYTILKHNIMKGYYTMKHKVINNNYFSIQIPNSETIENDSVFYFVVKYDSLLQNSKLLAQFVKNKNKKYSLDDFLETTIFINDNEDNFIINSKLNMFGYWNKQGDFSQIQCKGALADVFIKQSLITQLDVIKKGENNKYSFKIVNNDTESFLVVYVIYSQIGNKTDKEVVAQLYGIQKYSKQGEFLGEQLYRPNKNNKVFLFNPIGVLNSQLVCLCKSEKKRYELKFIDVKKL